ncbi:MAG: type II toxin-antitoxin system HicB family antitoxin [Candidatus Altiarchaeales archaeon]|nr:MAG: type II toxin-antitoxin system HicB family antitoxin [Candidatus Altiarchaeales archaeon]
MEKYTLSAVVNPEDDGFVSWCSELDIASQGDTIEEAVENLKAIEPCLEDEDAELSVEHPLITTVEENGI